ncbi:MAG: rhomboid family intramembrane serine protease [Pseudodesulfovibrio sp.]|jgi:membrane associated rhomboid family serine protease|uniref:Rhomboid family intramembrane serine protease n=2 Tax=Pseudodesulfovibrio indicus TaxID=1716143 RepID=A0ABN4M101_9BACT|nr:rhomboid family intramembrane serine protease [Pseudodesulfovibrio indicus]AMK12390.1 rhomboid family intramembrane serine protease [Pseudodesulfovibrio indicus]
MVDRTGHPGFFRRVLRHAWMDMVPLVRGEDSPPLTRKEAQDWSLVLSARHVPHRLRRPDNGPGWSVLVQEWFAPRAVEEINLYFEENRPVPGSVSLPDLRPVSGLEPTLFGLAVLVLFYWAYTRTYPALRLYPELWVELGSADAGAILSGQWWRLCTALTLHADGPHVAGNAVIGGVFIWLAARRIGSGLTWFLTILAGVLGNLFNSLALGVHHDSIGFSTATFGAAGVLAAISPFAVGGGLHGLGSGSLAGRAARFVRTALIPFGAGLGLLAMLGAGDGEGNIDLGAHLFGFASGLALGGLTGFLATRLGLPGKSADFRLYVAALCLPAAAWAWGWLA